MRQVIQDNRGRTVRTIDAPPPQLLPDGMLVRTAFSVLSAGTELAKVKLARQTLLGKARSRPDLVRQVLETARREGPAATYAKVMSRLSEPGLLGYSLAGEVIAVGARATGFSVGDRVACAGQGYANHAEVVYVPRNLAAHVPAGVDLADAAFTTVAAIALHGFRTSEAVLGERVGVIGLGLIGLLAVQMAAAAGCEVYGFDPQTERLELARTFGLKGALDGAAPPVDAAIVCASAGGPGPLEQAIAACRDRGRVVVVGNVPIAAEREKLYRKELELVVARSYGPGRYDRAYEEDGHDYPLSYVRWTEQRNMEAVLALMAAGRLRVAALAGGRVPIAEAEDAYARLEAGEQITLLLEYPDNDASPMATTARSFPPRTSTEHPRVAFVGAGHFARGTLIPAFKAAGAELDAVVTGRGATATSTAAQFQFHRTASSLTEILAGDRRPDAVVVATRDRSHSPFATEALAAGAYVWVEKPLALDETDIEQVLGATTAEQQARLMVGFNRRFSPFGKRLATALHSRGGPLLMHYRVNAGALAPDHWVFSEDGGGRFRNESGHFFDFMRHLARSPIVTVEAVATADGRPGYAGENHFVQLTFADGSLGSLHYLTSGAPTLAKERLELHSAGLSAVLDDFRELEMHGADSVKRVRSRLGQDKGHRAAVAEFLKAVRQGGPSPIPFAEALNVTLATLAAEASLRLRVPFAVDDASIRPL